MCVNDVITSGAKPLFFLDYLATSKIKYDVHSEVLKSIKRSCEKCDMSLIGGETAEMPGMYGTGDYDLAGFCVGIVSESKIISPSRIKNGDIIIGLNSSGFHSNGYSLINRLIEEKRLRIQNKFENKKIADILIKPTRLYVKIIDSLLKKININGLAHITGGGLTDNIPRIIPKDYVASIDLNSLKIPRVFRYIQDLAIIDDEELLKTFNCGIGMVIVIDKKYMNTAHKILRENKYSYKIIGQTLRDSSKIKINVCRLKNL